MKNIVAFACLLILVAAGAQAVEYRTHDLGTWIDGWNCFAKDFNSKGQVIGSASSESQGCYSFIWENGSYTAIGTLYEGDYSATTSINEQGQVSGYGSHSGFVWENGVMTKLETLAGDDRWGAAMCVNDNGQIAGTSSTDLSYSATVWHNGTKTDLGGSSSIAYSINNRGQAVGSSRISNRIGIHAVLWEGGSTTILEVFGGKTNRATAINDSGQIVGDSTGIDFGTHAFLYDDGVVTDLGTFGGGTSYACDINEFGQIVGYAYTLEEYRRAFVWQDGEMLDLGTLGGTSSWASAILDNGWICGSAETADGISHAVLWEPVPEPSSILALVSGFGGLGLAVRRRIR